jgi:putative inorganic carbon (hco3(-)) transporter
MEGHKPIEIASSCDRAMLVAFCALAFSLPVSIALTDLCAGLAILFYLVKKIKGSLFSGRISLKDLAPAASVLNRPIAALTLVTFVSVLQSQFLGVSLHAFVGKFLKAIFLYFSFIEVFVTPKRLKIFLTVFLLSSLLIALDGLFQYFSGWDFIAHHPLPPDARICASLKMANSLGVYLIVVLALVIQQLYAEAKRRRFSLLQTGLIILLLMLLFCLTWTFSRASWLGFMALLVFMMFWDRRKIPYLIILLLMFICSALPLLKEVRHASLIKDNISTAIDFQQPWTKIARDYFSESGSGRIHFWESAVFLIKKNPVFGSGLNTYTLMLRRFSLPYWYAHNSYLQIAAECGFIGLACFLWMLFVLVKNGMGAVKSIQDPWLNALVTGSLGAVVGFIVDSFLDNSLFEVQLVVLFWTMVALTVAAMNLSSKNASLWATKSSSSIPTA